MNKRPLVRFSLASRVFGRRLRAAAFVPLLAFGPSAVNSRAQSSAELLYSWEDGRATYHLSNGILSFESTSRITGAGEPKPVYDYNGRVNVSSLELEGVSIDDGGVPNSVSFRIYCKGHRDGESENAGDNCLSVTSSYKTSDASLAYTNRDSTDDHLDIRCQTQSECANFLRAIKESVRPKERLSSQEEGVDGAVKRGPQTSRTPIPSPSPPTKPGQQSGSDPFSDILNDIQRRNDGSGKNTLDQLGKRPIPKRPSPDPTKLLFVAFAQSAGFDANDQYGAETDSNLNTAISKANTSCVAKAKTMCGDEGYCQLFPGMFGAWASDRKYMGSKGFACNLPTEEEAVEQALAWCGAGCKVLWRGGN